MNNTLFTVLCFVLLLSHCIHKRLTTTPTRQDAIEQAKQYKQLKELLKYEERPLKRYKLLKQMDSLRNIKNEYSYINK